MGTANAVMVDQTIIVCANDAGEQREFRVGWDNSNSFFEGKGDIAALFCSIGTQNQWRTFVSTTLTDEALRYYNGAIPNQIVIPIVDTPTTIVETQTPQVVETSTSEVPSDTPTANVETSTPTNDSATSIVAPVETQTLTSESSTQTNPVETSTPIVETPLPTPPPAVEPQPVPVPAPPAPEPPAPQPEPQPQPEPAPEPPPIAEEPPLEAPEPEPAPPAPAEQPPAEPPSAPPVEEDTNEIPLPPAPEEQPAPSPEPLPQPVAEPAPTSQPEISYEPPMVTLDNGVTLTQEEAVAIVLLQNPAELLSELFTDPGAVLSALGSVGADMTPEAREESEKVILASVIAGNIATQAAATAGAVAAYRRKP